MNKPHLIRQGDVLLIEVAALPKGAKDVTPDGDVILAYGEVTGHAHRISQTKDAPKVRVWDAGGERFIQRIEADARLTHEEHSAAVIERPIYRLVGWHSGHKIGSQERLAAAAPVPAREWTDVQRDADRYRLLRIVSFDDDSFDAYDAEGLDAELDRRLALPPPAADK